MLIINLANIFFILKWLRTDVFMLDNLVLAVVVGFWSYFIERRLWYFYCILIIPLLMVLLKQQLSIFEENIISTASSFIFSKTGFCG